MSAAACLTLATVHALIWGRRRRRAEARANLLFAASAVATALMAAGKL